MEVVQLASQYWDTVNIGGRQQWDHVGTANHRPQERKIGTRLDKDSHGVYCVLIQKKPWVREVNEKLLCAGRFRDWLTDWLTD